LLRRDGLIWSRQILLMLSDSRLHLWLFQLFWP
jgi:hypothetical protein